MSSSGMNFLCLHVGKIIYTNCIFRNRLIVYQVLRFSPLRLSPFALKLELKFESG